jgi:hypothetical protein
LQLLFAPAMLAALVFDLVVRPRLPLSAVVLAAFVLSTMPFALRAVAKDPLVGLLSPALLALRACAQVLGVGLGLISARSRLSQLPTKSAA